VRDLRCAPQQSKGPDAARLPSAVVSGRTRPAKGSARSGDGIRTHDPNLGKVVLNAGRPASEAAAKSRCRHRLLIPLLISTNCETAARNAHEGLWNGLNPATARPVSRLTRARTSSINSSSLFHLHPDDWHGRPPDQLNSARQGKCPACPLASPLARFMEWQAPHPSPRRKHAPAAISRAASSAPPDDAAAMAIVLGNFDDDVLGRGTHKIANLINVRFGLLCGLRSDITRGPRSDKRRPLHCSNPTIRSLRPQWRTARAAR
jgi:hypothetical protein